MAVGEEVQRHEGRAWARASLLAGGRRNRKEAAELGRSEGGLRSQGVPRGWSKHAGSRGLRVNALRSQNVPEARTAILRAQRG